MSEEAEAALKIGDRVSIDAKSPPAPVNKNERRKSSGKAPGATAAAAAAASAAASNKSDPSGVVAFLGETRFAKGEWAGIVLDPEYVATHGKNDGAVKGTR